MRFVERHRAWIEQERIRIAALPGSRGWTTGTGILLRGRPETLVVAPSPEGATVRYADRMVRVPPGSQDVRPFVERDLRALAREDLAPRLLALAAQHQLVVRRVTIRDQRSRWGSCSPNGSIALNFRLVQMPPEVCDYVLVHELMHLRQQNHSRRFWRLVEAVCPAFREAEKWLKTEGRLLF